MINTTGTPAKKMGGGAQALQHFKIIAGTKFNLATTAVTVLLTCILNSVSFLVYTL